MRHHRQGDGLACPSDLTWAHEHPDEEMLAGKEFAVLERIALLPEWLTRRAG
jgi:hypothetical protein